MDQLIQQKRQFAEVALKKSFVLGQRVPSAGLRQLEIQQEREEAIQKMDTGEFLKFLNRSQKEGELKNSILHDVREQGATGNASP